MISGRSIALLVGASQHGKEGELRGTLMARCVFICGLIKMAGVVVIFRIWVIMRKIWDSESCSKKLRSLYLPLRLLP